MTRAWIAVTLLGLLSLGGCPTPSDGTSPVQAAITISSTHGSAPLDVTVSAEQSTSSNAGDLAYAWDFGDGTTATGASATHTYTSPGRYTVTLLVTDQTGATDTVTQDVRVAGSGAVAIIAADRTTGDAPLVVQFDGTQSLVPDDTILDYYWDFGDGDTSRESGPQHIFFNDGAFTVRLKIVTAGGVEAETSTTINVGARNAALQFDGTSLALLPLGSAHTLDACTVEIWVKADSDGGTAVSVGDGKLTIALQPGSNEITLTANGVSGNAAATSLAGTWRHVAAVYSGAGASGSCALYLDGVAIGHLTVTGALTVDKITLGSGFRGKIADVRFWGVARNSVEVAANRNKRLTGTEANLIGYWPLDQGSGQTLHNAVSGGAVGTLGLSASVEDADPAWSTDGPPL